MRVNGIIAEYNPFHTGHKYLLTESKKATSADYTVIVMSGNFVQRGAPALINKYKRAEMALQNGADLVLELPMYYATSSAEYFAMGGISLLDKLGVVTNLSFGSECGDLAVLEKIARILAKEPADYALLLRENLKKGQSYPTARTNALLKYDADFEKYKDVLSSPNNILGIEYLKALLKRNSSIQPFTLQRAGAGYHDTQLNNVQCSAQGIREAVFDKHNTKAAKECKGQLSELLSNQMPESAHTLLYDCIQQGTFLHTNDFSGMLHYKLLTEFSKGFTEYLDVTPDLSDRICKNVLQYNSFQGFCDRLKTKDMTYTRISRCLVHIMLDIKTESLGVYRTFDYTPYARVLGFKKDATPLMNAIKKKSNIPLITKLADAEQYIEGEALEMLKGDILRNTIYESAMAIKSGKPMANEYRTPIVIV